MKKLSVFVFFVLLLAGCASDGPKTPPLSHAVPVDPPSGSLMLTANTYAGDVLSVELLQRLGSGSGILAATMADMEELDDSSPFGRTSMQQVGSRVAQHGFKVLDVRLTDAMRMDLRKGEFMLSRDTARILAKEYNAHAVLVGLYSRSDDKIFVSVRAIRLDDAAIIGAYEYWLPKEGDVRAMLTNRKIGGEDLISKYTRRSKVSGTQPDVGCGAPVVTASSVQKAPPKAAAAPAPRPAARKSTPRPRKTSAPKPAAASVVARPAPAPVRPAQPCEEKDTPGPDMRYPPESYEAPSGGVPIKP
jgi:hypothetical protein